MSETENNPKSQPVEQIEALLPTMTRYLDPASVRIHLGNHGVLHVTIRDERIYGGVFATLLFPVRHPEQYISMRHTDSEAKEVEVGIIRNLADWPEDVQRLVRVSLNQRYFVHHIEKINNISWKWGMIRFEVLTNKGPRDFLMRWRGDRAVAFGEHGKVLIDLDENSYLIPDLNALTSRESKMFLRFIYW